MKRDSETGDGIAYRIHKHCKQSPPLKCQHPEIPNDTGRRRWWNSLSLTLLVIRVSLVIAISFSSFFCRMKNWNHCLTTAGFSLWTPSPSMVRFFFLSKFQTLNFTRLLFPLFYWYSTGVCVGIWMSDCDGRRWFWWRWCDLR